MRHQACGARGDIAMNISNEMAAAQLTLDRIHDATEAKVTLGRLLDAHNKFFGILKKHTKKPPEFGSMTFDRKGEAVIACLDKTLHFEFRPIASLGCVYAIEYSATTNTQGRKTTIFHFYLDEHCRLWADPLHEIALWKLDDPYLLTNILAFTSRALLDSMLFKPD